MKFTFQEFVSRTGRFPTALECVLKLKSIGIHPFYGDGAVGYAGTDPWNIDAKMWQMCLSSHNSYLGEIYEACSGKRDSCLSDRDVVMRMLDEGYTFDIENGNVIVIGTPEVPVHWLEDQFSIRQDRISETIAKKGKV